MTAVAKGMHMQRDGRKWTVQCLGDCGHQWGGLPYSEASQLTIRHICWRNPKMSKGKLTLSVERVEISSPQGETIPTFHAWGINIISRATKPSNTVKPVLGILGTPTQPRLYYTATKANEVAHREAKGLTGDGFDVQVWEGGEDGS